MSEGKASSEEPEEDQQVTPKELANDVQGNFKGQTPDASQDLITQLSEETEE